MGWADFIKPVASVVGGLWDGYQQHSTGSDFADALRAQEDRRYADAKQYYDAYTNWLGQSQAAAGSAAAANAAAAAATDANRRAALKRAMKFQKKQYNQAQGMYQPYADVGRRLLPQAEQTYGNSLGGMNLLFGYLNSPGQLAKLNQAAPVTATNIGKLPK